MTASYSHQVRKHGLETAMLTNLEGQRWPKKNTDKGGRHI